MLKVLKYFSKKHTFVYICVVGNATNRKNTLLKIEILEFR